jgi:hypothetical protein
MAVTKNTEKQLQSLLGQFFIAYSPGVKNSRDIFAYLFEDQMLPPFYADADLYKTLLYLRDVINSQGLDNIESLQQYVDSKKLKINRFLSNLIGETTNDIRNSVPDRPIVELKAQKPPMLDNYYERICQFLDSLDETALAKPSRFAKIRSTINRLDNDDPSHYIQFYQYCLRGLAKVYLEEFASGMNGSGGFYILDRAGYSSRSSDDFEGGRVYMFDFTAFQSSFGSGHQSKKGVVDQKYYQIMRQVKRERPIWGRQFKLMVLEWIFCDIDHRKMSAEVDGNDALRATELLLRRWAILKCPAKQSWITSDNPGFIINMRSLESGAGPFYSSVSLSHTEEHAVLYYPLSKDYCLRIDSGADGNGEMPLSDDPVSFVCCSNRELHLVNRLSAATGNDVIVGSDKRILEQYVRRDSDFAKPEMIGMSK